MSKYRFKHAGEIYHAEEDGDIVIVRWYESDGHDEDGELNHHASIINSYIANGTYALLPDSRLCEEIPLPGEEMGVFRPELGSRKVGKVRVELVDDGFPLALREIAKVMTWAQTAKGYKDHDWQNLPDAEIQLAAAASRHRTDAIFQRLQGLPVGERVDPESKLLHKAHEAFGVLAQLELMLREAQESV